MKYRILTALLCCIMFISGLNINIVKADIDPGIPEDYILIGESKNIQLYYSHDRNFISIIDKGNGFVWSSPSALVEAKDGENPADLKDNMQALFNFSYANMANDKGQVVETNSIAEKAEVDYEEIEDGISLSYDFTKLGISIAIEIYLDNDSLVFRIPEEKITEYGDWGLISIEPLSFFGASEIGEDGYIFYPDGSGALFYLDKKPKDISKYSFYIYGTDKIDYREFREEVSVMLPVFGMKRKDNAFLAIIREGDFDACINLYPSGYIADFNRISTEFTYRRLYEDPYRSDDKILYKVEKDRIEGDREIEYRFLNQDQANYSGMANEYRDYLIDKEAINKNDFSDNHIPLGLDFFMGIKEERILFDKFIPATTFEQVETILEKLKKKDIDSIETTLKGWQKGGYGNYNAKPVPDKNIGGKKGLKKLGKYHDENSFSLYLQSNLTDVNSKSKGFTPRKEAVYQANGMIATSGQGSRYLVNPIAAFDKFSRKYLPEVKKYYIDGLSFDMFGSQLYHDYNKNGNATREQTSQSWGQIMELSKENFEDVHVYGGNVYALKNADRLSNIPPKDNSFFITDGSIPFYQMVVHGMVPYTSNQPGNLFHDFPRQKLKWVEYGYMPYFELTYQDSGVLKNTDYNKLFSSSYENWLDRIEDVYKEFNSRLADTWSQTILKHEELEDDVYLVIYEDGTRVYVNYRSESVKVHDETIDPLDYLVINKEGDKK